MASFQGVSINEMQQVEGGSFWDSVSNFIQSHPVLETGLVIAATVAIAA